jgi:hypothetical protein
MFPLWFALLGGSFVFLDLGPSILFPVFLFFWGALVYLWLVGFHHDITLNIYDIIFTLKIVVFEKIVKEN